MCQAAGSEDMEAWGRLMPSRWPLFEHEIYRIAMFASCANALNKRCKRKEETNSSFVSMTFSSVHRLNYASWITKALYDAGCFLLFVGCNDYFACSFHDEKDNWGKEFSPSNALK